MSESLYEKLSEYCQDGNIPMHMPGHKRNTSDFPYLAALGGALDITEIDSFDDLNDPSGIFAESEHLAAELWGSDECSFSVNGSTGALLAAIRAALACRTARRVIVARNCHRSVYHALELCDARAEYIVPQQCTLGFAVSISPEQVAAALDGCPDAAAVVITSPTYEGVISDVRAIADICHAHGVPLIVDEAHGAHLSLGGAFPAGAVACGADIAVHSLHKTLPSLTQTAAVHVSGKLVSQRELRRQMAIFQTSSPSYLLSASIDGAVRYLACADAAERLCRWHSAADALRCRLAERGLAALPEKMHGVFAADASKLILTSADSGTSLMQTLRRHSVELEMASVRYAVAMTGLGDNVESFAALESAIADAVADKSICLACTAESSEHSSTSTHIPKCVMSASEAVTRSFEHVTLKLSVGRVSAGYVYAYPPGIPLLVPGELIDRTCIQLIDELSAVGASVRGMRSDGTLPCLCEKGDSDEK